MRQVDQAKIGKGTRVLVRCDLDVPVEGKTILETFRLDASLRTLNYILEKGGVPIVCGHLGRPGGKTVPELSTIVLKQYFDTKLHGGYELLENLRFNPGEEKNSPEFAQHLASLAEVYVNESFANSLREAASIIGVPKLLPSYAGFRLALEKSTLEKVLHNPSRPLLAVIGGAKIESKRPVIQKFAELADGVLVGGRLALEEPIIMDKVFSPVDYVDQKDIGPKTLEGWKDMILGARTILWAGPVGAFEEEKYSTGTRTVAELMVEAKKSGSFTLAGGGDTITALNKYSLLNEFSFVSTGGSAMLDFLVAGTLPGLSVIPE